MTFKHAVASCLRQYAIFRGRAPRAEYWWFYLFTSLVGIVAARVDAVLENGVVGLVAWLLLVVPSLAVTVRRLHDSNLAGWWVLAPAGAFLAGLAAVSYAVVRTMLGAFGTGDLAPLPSGIAAGVVGALLFLAAFVGWLVLLLRRSSPGPNRFGPHPYGTVTPYGPGPAEPSRSGSDRVW